MVSIYILIALVNFAEGLMSIFVPIYFWKLGFPIWKILSFYFLVSLFFVIITFLLLPLLRRLSDKLMMFFSAPFLVFYYVGLSVLPEIPTLFYVLPAVGALAALLFNVGYHIDFSGSSSDGYIGREVGFGSTVGALAQFAAPVVGGFLIAIFGFADNFFIGSGILVLAMIPLFFFPGRKSSSDLRGSLLCKFLFDKNLLPFTLSGVGYSVETSVARVMWPLFIFLAIGGVEEFGGIISIGLLGGALATYLTGVVSDQGKRRKVLAWCAGIFSAFWIARPFFISSFAVVANHVGGNIFNSSLMVTYTSQYYKIARSFRVPVLFILSREVLYNATRVLVLPIFMYIAYAFSQNTFFTASFIIAAIFTLFYFFANRFHISAL